MKFLTLILSIALFVSCKQEQKHEYKALDTKTTVHADMHKALVKEVIQASSYTYIKVQENQVDVWVATGKVNVPVGAEIYYRQGTKMTNFNSKELDRVFETIYFVDAISDEPMTTRTAQKNTAPHKTKKASTKKSTKLKQDIKIAPIKGGTSIADLYKNKAALSGKKVLLKGKVVKVNKNIIDRNWIHIQDGSQYENTYSVTITSTELVNVGDVVTFEGVVTLDKKFGAGYSYDLIIEEGIVK